MPIDFRDPAYRRTYSGREADSSWRDAAVALVDPAGARVVDIGCGGGAYPRAWHDLGAATVTGVDFSRAAAGQRPGRARRSPRRRIPVGRCGGHRSRRRLR